MFDTLVQSTTEHVVTCTSASGLILQAIYRLTQRCIYEQLARGCYVLASRQELDRVIILCFSEWFSFLNFENLVHANDRAFLYVCGCPWTEYVNRCGWVSMCFINRRLFKATRLWVGCGLIRLVFIFVSPCCYHRLLYASIAFTLQCICNSLLFLLHCFIAPYGHLKCCTCKRVFLTDVQWTTTYLLTYLLTCLRYNFVEGNFTDGQIF